MIFYKSNNTKQQAKEIAEYATYCNELLNNVYVNMIEVFKKWDGKKINIRFTQQLQELLPQKTNLYGKELDLCSVDIYKESYSDKKYISIHLRIFEPEVYLNCNTTRIRINDLGFIDRLYIYNEYLTPEGKIIADNFIEHINSIMHQNYLKEVKFVDAYENFENYQKIIEDTKDFIKNQMSITNVLFIPSEFAMFRPTISKWQEKISNRIHNPKQ